MLSSRHHRRKKKKGMASSSSQRAQKQLLLTRIQRLAFLLILVMVERCGPLAMMPLASAFSFRPTFAVRSAVGGSQAPLFASKKATPAAAPAFSSSAVASVATQDGDLSTSGRRLGRTANTVKARAILDYFKSNYTGHDEDNKKEDWIKLRNYLYRATRPSLDATSASTSSASAAATTTTTTTTLTLEQVQRVVTCLEDDFQIPPDTIRHIVQTTPRLLRKPVGTFVRPTAAFVRDLWGPELFQQAVARNPQVLLTSGVGYTPATASTTNHHRQGEEEREDEEQTEDDRVADLLQSYAGLSFKSLLQFKRTAPFVFGLSPGKVQSVLEYLTSLLVVVVVEEEEAPGSSKAEAIIKKPSRRISVATKRQIQKQKQTLAKIITKHPNLLNLSVNTNLQPRVAFLQSYCGLASDIDLRKLIQASVGSILGLSVEGNLRPKLEYWKALLLSTGSSSSSSSSSSRNPSSTSSSSTALVRKSILAHPALLALSLSNIQSKVEYFDSLEEEDEHENDNSALIPQRLAARIALRCPAVYSLSLTGNIQPTLSFLSKIWGCGNQENDHDNGNNNHDEEDLSTTSYYSLASQLREYPTVLTLSLLGNLQPTLIFYNRTGYTALGDEWEFQDTRIACLENATRIRGRYLAASLYQRLLPRWHFFQSQRPSDDLDQGASTTTTTAAATATATAAATSSTRSSSNEESKSDDDDDDDDDPRDTDAAVLPARPPLHLLAVASDEVFCSTFGFPVQDYEDFKEQAIPRLKFSSQFDMWLKTGRPIEV